MDKDGYLGLTSTQKSRALSTIHLDYYLYQYISEGINTYRLVSEPIDLKNLKETYKYGKQDIKVKEFILPKEGKLEIKIKRHEIIDMTKHLK